MLLINRRFQLVDIGTLCIDLDFQQTRWWVSVHTELESIKYD